MNGWKLSKLFNESIIIFGSCRFCIPVLDLDRSLSGRVFDLCLPGLDSLVSASLNVPPQKTTKSNATNEDECQHQIKWDAEVSFPSIALASCGLALDILIQGTGHLTFLGANFCCADACYHFTKSASALHAVLGVLAASNDVALTWWKYAKIIKDAHLIWIWIGRPLLQVQ